jgi:sulfite reductase (NADPH) flavoprotein alpha-component
MFLAGLIIGVYLVWSVWLIRRHKKSPEVTEQPASDVLVGFASQTGHAQQLAALTMEALNAGGLNVHMAPLSEVTAQMLSDSSRALFIVSTTGEGDAPDTAARFVRDVMSESHRFDTLQYGLLALGDRRYSYFCGFGHSLDTWLQQSHALPMFDMVEVDDGEAGALRHWQSQLGLVAGTQETADWNPPVYESWRLKDRQLLNPGSAGDPVYHLKLEAIRSAGLWQAGDIAEIGPRNSPQAVNAFLNVLGLESVAASDEQGASLFRRLANRMLPNNDADMEALRGLQSEELMAVLKPLSHREYSIASLPYEGMELVVRQVRRADGELGHGSGWLTEYAAIGDEIALRVRENPAFHPPSNTAPLILIGNGTGIAGLRAHLKASTRAGQTRHWLIFGERNKAHDAYFGDELHTWREQGVLTRLDLAYSRDQQSPVYVQDLLRNAVDELRIWLSEGAAIFVCGSASGMAPGVHHVLAEAIGDDALAELATSGRYRRDIY